MKYVDIKSIASSIFGALLLAAIVWFSGVIGSVKNILVPPGAIVAFSVDCPADGTWEEYVLARNSFLRGVPSGEKAGDTGGTDSVILDITNMPEHRHGVHGTDNTITTKTHDSSPYEYGKYIENYTYTAYAGAEDPVPVKVLPPYVNVKYCVKK